MLPKIPETEILIFTDGSALTNPGPTGGSAIVFLDGSTSSPICLKKSHSSCSNNYVGELVGLQLGLNFLNSMDLTERSHRIVHFFTDCQPAITAAFFNAVPENNVELVMGIKETLWEVQKKGMEIRVHWCPGHMDIRGNELADKFAKEAANEAISMTDNLSVLTKKDATAELKKNIIKKWQKAYILSESAGKIQDIVSSEKVGQRSTVGEERKKEYRILNHLMSGHSLLNDHRAKINSNSSNLCEVCHVPETVEHFLFDCDRFSGPREAMKNDALRIVACENLKCADADIKTLTGNAEEISKAGEAEMVNILLQYIQETHRFFSQ
ncbi:MAG: ribonuclease H family protein [Candidatus Thiodiazotropha sp.]